MNYLKKDLIKLLVIPLLFSMNAEAMLKLARTGNALKTIKSIPPVKLKPGTLLSQIPNIDLQKTPKNNLKEISLSNEQKNALQLQFIEEIVENPEVFEKLITAESSSNLPASSGVVVQIEGKPAEPAKKKTGIFGTEIWNQIVEKGKKNAAEILKKIQEKHQALYDASFELLQEPSLQPVFAEYIAQHPGLGVLGDGMKNVSDLNQKALTLSQQKDLVLKGTELIKKFEKNVFGKSIEELVELADKTPKKIDSLFRKLSLTVHPDKGGSKDLFGKLVELKDLLISPEGRALLKIGEFKRINPEITALCIEGKIPAPEQLEILFTEAAKGDSFKKVEAITLPEVSPKVTEVTTEIAQALGKKISPHVAEALIGKITQNPSGNGSLPPIKTSGDGEIVKVPGSKPIKEELKIPTITADLTQIDDKKKEEEKKEPIFPKLPVIEEEKKEEIKKPIVPEIIKKKKKKKLDFSDLIKRAEALRDEIDALEVRIDNAIAL